MGAKEVESGAFRQSRLCELCTGCRIGAMDREQPDSDGGMCSGMSRTLATFVEGGAPNGRAGGLQHPAQPTQARLAGGLRFDARSHVALMRPALMARNTVERLTPAAAAALMRLYTAIAPYRDGHQSDVARGW
jgi:hypothetical protein